MPLPILVLATRNRHKTEEIRAVLGDLFQYRTLTDLPGLPTIDETGATFAENAHLKAHAIALHLLQSSPPDFPHSHSLVLADDSGLEVDALDGAPGVHSARFASADLHLPGNAPDAANNARLLRCLHAIPPNRRTARFRCALALTRVQPDLDTVHCEGRCDGHIAFVPRGTHGFGYDPLFIPDDFTESFAQLGDDTKNRISHRARALAQLRSHLRPQPSMD
jgi:XTP/dITP diphosphohydrolase